EIGLQLVENRAAMVAVGRPVHAGPRRDRDDRVHEAIEALDRLGQPLDVRRRQVALVRARLALRAGHQAEDLPVIADRLLIDRKNPAAVWFDLGGEVLRGLGGFVVSHRVWLPRRRTLADLAEQDHPLLTLPSPDRARRKRALNAKCRREQPAYLAL